MNTFRNYALIIFGLAFILNGCRKEIDHQPGSDGPMEGLWLFHTDPDSRRGLRTLEVYNGELYMGGDGDPGWGGWSSYSCLAKLANDGSVIPIEDPIFFQAYNNSDEPKVLDLQVYNNELFAGGYFKIEKQAQTFYGLIKLDAAGDFAGLGHTASSTTVRRLALLDGNLIITGAVPNNLQKYSNGTMTNASQSAGMFVNDGGVTGTAFVIVGDDGEISAGSGSFQYWTPLNVPLALPGEDLRSFVRFGDYEYVTSEFSSRIFVRSLVTDQWSLMTLPTGYIPANSNSWTEHSVRFKVIDNELYLMSGGVYKLEGTEWTRVGKLKVDVFDLAKYNGRLYAATIYGLMVAPL